ncbi:MAG TPA: hypothetical protein DDW20_02070 [Firmicutes bacterium]|nr:hypothetical protein [Bacillota bacterium]
MNDKYLIAFDMDGTLLNSKKKISLLTKLYLKKLQKQGHKIILASGRPSRALKSYYNELHLNTPMICYNGAYYFSPNDKAFPTHEFEFPKEIVKTIYDEIKPYAKNVMCETDTEIWLDKEDLYLAKFFWYEGMKMHYGELPKILDKNPMTMIVQTPIEMKDSSLIDKIVEKYEGISARFWTGSPYFELFYSVTSKGNAIKEVAKYYGIDKDHIIVFGDAENDVEMFKEAGTAIAMKNGKDSLKSHATSISLKDNDHNGIYYTLKAFFKKKLR